MARAYKELEQAGLIETRRRNGNVVVGMPDDGLPAGRAAGLDDATLQGILRVRLGHSQ